MNERALFLKAIRTLLYTWGGDTPPEAIWTLQELIEWLNKEFGLNIESPTEDDYYNGDSTAFEKKMFKIEQEIVNLKGRNE